MAKRIYIFQVTVYKDSEKPTSLFKSCILSTDEGTAESDIRDAIIDDSDGEIGRFETKMIANFAETEVGYFDQN
jgi:hypothetical protein